MAKEHSKDAGDKLAELVPFQTIQDTGCRDVSDCDVPVIVLNPKASAIDLWEVAESRINGLESMLGLIVSIADNGEVGRLAEAILPRVEEIRILADEATKRARKKSGAVLNIVKDAAN